MQFKRIGFYQPTAGILCNALLVTVMGSTLVGCDNNNPSTYDPNANPLNPSPGPSPAPTPDPTPSPNPTPTPTPTPTPGPVGGASAADCYNGAFETAGTKLDQTFQITDSSNGATLTTVSSTTVQGSSTFNGQAAIRSSYTQDTTGSAPSSSTGNTYTRNAGTARVETLGVEEKSTATVSGYTANTDTTTKFDPANLRRFDLNAGDSYTQTYTVTTSGTVTAAGFSTPVNNSTSISEKVTYLGRESVTVPLGTFANACKVLTESTAGGSTTSTTVWFAPGSGVSLKQVSGTTTSVTSDAKINGTKVTP